MLLHRNSFPRMSRAGGVVNLMYDDLMIIGQPTVPMLGTASIGIESKAPMLAMSILRETIHFDGIFEAR